MKTVIASILFIALCYSCTPKDQALKQSISYDTSITDLTRYLDSANPPGDTNWLLFFNHQFDNYLTIRLNNSLFADTQIVTNNTLGLAASFSIPKRDNPSVVSISLDNITVADFVADTNYRNIHISRIADSIHVEFTNNIRIYE